MFGNDIDALGVPSNTDDANYDDVKSDEDEDAHFQGEHVHHVEPSHSSSGNTESTEGTLGTDNSNSQSNIYDMANTDDTSNTDETSNPDDSSGNDQGNINSWELHWKLRKVLFKMQLMQGGI